MAVRRICRAVALAGGLLYGGCAAYAPPPAALSSPTPAAVAEAAAIPPSEMAPATAGSHYVYPIGAADVIKVEVNGGVEKEFCGQFEVDSRGSIDYPFLGELSLLGLSEEEAAHKMATLLSKEYLVDPRVKVTVVDYQSQKVTVVGAIKQPGTYPLKKNRDLLYILGQAGGLLEKGTGYVLVVRHEAASAGGGKADPAEGARTFIVDLEKLTAKGDLTQNIEIKNGDIINVQGAKQVFVYGSVRNPGAVAFSKGMTVREALSLAGGPTAEASLSGAYILRGANTGKEQKIRVNLSLIVAGKAIPVPLEEGDFLTVPESFF